MSPSTTQPTATFDGVTLGKAMRPGVVTVAPDDTVALLAKTMSEQGIHAAVVAATPSAFPSVVSDLELIRAALHGHSDAHAHTLSHDPVATVTADATLLHVVAKMAELYLTHVLVVTPESREYQGIISSFDVAAILGGANPAAARLIRPTPRRLLRNAPALRTALAREVMHRSVITCCPDEPVVGVARCMAERHVHCVAVVGVSAGGGWGTVFNWGLVETLDIVRAAHRHAFEEPAASIARAAPTAVAEDDPVLRAAELMLEHETAHVVVVGPSGMPSGMLSSLDVIDVVAAEALCVVPPAGVREGH